MDFASFHIRFKDPASLRPWDASTLEQVAFDAVKRTSGPSHDVSLEVTLPPEAKSANRGPCRTPWFDEFAHDVCDQVGISEIETFNHPVACFMVVSTLDRDPVSTLVQLFNSGTASLPGHEKGYLDPNFLRYYVLVQDRHKTTDEQ